MLRSLHGEDHVLPIKDTVILGRNRLTRMKDISCSRSQMEVAYDRSTDSYRVRHVGKHRSVVAGNLLSKGDVVTLKPGDVLELLPGRCKFRFEQSKRAASMQTSLDFFACRNVELLKNRKWLRSSGLMVFTVGEVTPSKKIAAFDLDGTIIVTMSGRVFSKDATDWTLFTGAVITKLKRLTSTGYNVVIFTNQRGISSGRTTEEEFQSKMERIANVLYMPFVCYVSTRDDIYRKPRLGMWERYCAQENSNLQVDMESSFFVGDAAGRSAALKRSKDHSCADRLFALNAGLHFQTPEEFFLNKPAEPYKLPSFNPRELVARPTEQLLEPAGSPLNAGKQEVIILVGLPGSGKTCFYMKYLEPNGYVHASMDVLGDAQRCTRQVEQSLEQGKSVVVDNTNADAKSRAIYVGLAKKLKVDCRCFVMNVTFEHAKHNNAYRKVCGADKAHITVTEAVMNTCKARYEEPVMSEGFSSIVKVNFLPHFEEQRHRDIYQMYLLEQ